MALQYRTTRDPTGLEVVDTSEQARLRLATSTGRFVPTSTDLPFGAFVDEALAVETRYLEVPSLVAVTVRDTAMNDVGLVRADERRSYPAGTHVLELGSAVKCYVLVSSAMTITPEGSRTRVELAEANSVVVGFRSTTSVPTATVETTDRPDDVAAAVSVLSSSLQTTSPERSWPNLRGHPPRVELGTTLSIPDELSAPDSGVEIVVPPRYAPLFAAAPAAYYLGADLQTGSTPHVRMGGRTHALGDVRSLEVDLGWFLRRSLVLDAVVRRYGHYDLQVDGHEALEAALPADPEALYDSTPADRLAAYLEVPVALLEPALPRWPLVAAVPPRAASVELLPHVCHRLGVVESARGRVTGTNQGPVAAFVRDGSGPDSNGQGTGPNPAVAAGRPRVVPESEVDAVTHAWFGPGVPRGASKASSTAYRNALARDPSDEVTVAIVCTDPEMLPEQRSLEEFYDGSLGLPRTVSLVSDADREEVAGVLTDDRTDLVHFVGHATPAGLECSDGPLDVRTLASVEPDLFVLNACETYEQATALVERGAVGGVAATTRVANEDAVHVGRDVARLLGDGFSISAAVEQVAGHLEAGRQYLVVGDGLSRLVVDGTELPLVATVRRRPTGAYELAAETYLRCAWSLGIHTSIVVGDPTNVERGLAPSVTESHVLPREATIRELVEWDAPYRYDGELYWPTDADAVDEVLD
ncbi:hypothetical protein [Haloarchaeobius sp. HRN-SO-5]|uniref:hypothetical protein n=1 Tax=Haloarchaeobius sp. HRN-SO-5 TaxID=3446118 RepID=UPI003EBF8190